MGSVGNVVSKFNEQRFGDRLDMYIGGGVAISGPGGVFDKADIQYIKNNMENTSSSMFRLEENSWTAKDLKVGSTINFNDELKSFAKNEQVMERLLQDSEEWGGYSQPVVFQTTGNIKYFDVQKQAEKIGNTNFSYQQEAFVKGKNWKITKIGNKTINGIQVKVVTIR